MALHMPAPIAPRPRRGLRLLVPALVVTAALGCSHKRTALRPMFLSPAPAPAVVAPSCPTTVAPSAVEPMSSASPTIVEPSAAPSFGEPPAASVPSLEGPATVGPSSTTPPQPGVVPNERRPRAVPGGEPPLELLPNAESSSSSSRILPGGASSRTPGPSFSNGRRAAPGRLRQTLRERLRPFVNDPEDLFTPPKAERPWKYVVLHHSAHASGGYDEIDREHRKVLGWDGCGYHFVIGNGTGSPDGRVEVARRWSDQKNGVHCGNGKTSEVNEYGIGICLVGDLDNASPTPRQIEAAQALVAYLGERYTIPPDHIGTHADLASTPTACPGKHFPRQAILGARNLAQR